MSVAYNSSIVTDGLVLLLDASNTKSYSGSGTLWSDLSSSGCNATFNVAPTYDTGNGKSLILNGTQSCTLTNPIATQHTSDQQWTVAAWVNIDSTATQYLINLNSGVCLDWYNAGCLLYLNGGANDYYMYGTNITNTGWCYMVYRFKNITGYRTIYKNGVNISTSGPNNTSTPVGSPGILTIGSNLHGKLSRIEVYSRVISDLEVLQNLRSLRGRYGV